ncbi:MAG: hypothetical protein HY744_26500, partial [Deltaproteobacteria bacterium]|nr:hypothetical protein [Deltaproteobacteria bacterium]
WSNCANHTSGGELWLNPPNLCSGSNCPNPGYIIRPCQGNYNWGGIKTPTCSPPTQSMSLSFK